MKNYSYLMLICFCGIFFQCTPTEIEDNCVQNNWIGTFVLDSDKECDVNSTVQGVITFKDEIQISAGSTVDQIIFDNVEIKIFECLAVNGTEILELKNNNIMLSINGCNATYLKN